LEAQPNPALRVPSFRDSMLLKDAMWNSALAQHVAHREPGLPAADDQCPYILNWQGIPAEFDCPGSGGWLKNRLDRNHKFLQHCLAQLK
jgi:hypothetical protein